MAVITPETVIAAYVAKLATISGIGNVYDYRREVRDEPTAKALWWNAAQNRINAWSVSLEDNAPVAATRGPGFGARGSGQVGTVTIAVNLQIDAVFGIDDASASERTFRALVYSVQQACNDEGLIVDGSAHQEPMIWARFGYLVLAGMYHTHFARLTTSVLGKVRP